MAEAPSPLSSPLLTATNPALTAELPQPPVQDQTELLTSLGFDLDATMDADQTELLTAAGFEEVYDPDRFQLTDLISTPLDVVGTGFGKATSRLMGSDIPDEHLANIYVDIGRLGPQIYGGYKGGKYGAQIGSKLPLPGWYKGAATAATTLTGATIGSVAGAGSPEALMLASDFLPFLPDDLMEKYGTDPAYMRQLLEGEALLELLTPAVLATGRQVGRTTGRVATGINRYSQELAEKAANRGINLMPVQVGRGRRGAAARMYVSVFGRFPFVAGPFRDIGKEISEEASTFLQGIKNQTGFDLAQVLPRSELGEKILKDGRELLKAVTTRFGRRYDAQAANALANNVYVIPDALVSKGLDIKADFLKRTMDEFGETAGRDAIDTINDKFVKWLDGNVLNMQVSGTPRMRPVVNPRTGVARRSLSGPVLEEVPTSQGLKELGTVPQSFDVAKNLDRQIESFMADLTVDQRSLVNPHLNQLRHALGLDLTKNVRQFASPITERLLREGEPLPEILGETPFIQKFVADSKALDQDFSLAMNDLFETPTANRFTRWTRGGFRGAGASLEKATQQDYDRVAQQLVNLGSTKAIDDYIKVVKPETYNETVASYINDAFWKATTRETENAAGDIVEVASDLFDPQKFLKALGMDRPKGDPFYKNLKHFFDKSTSYSMDEMEEIADVFRVMGNTEIPDVSTFLTRRIQLGGLRTILPIGAGATFGFAGFVPMALTLGGGRLLSSILADPLNARALKNVLTQESARGTRKMNWIRLLGNGLRGMYQNKMYEGSEREQREQYLEARKNMLELVDLYGEAVEDPAQFAEDRYAEAVELERKYAGDPLLIQFQDWWTGGDDKKYEEVLEYIRSQDQAASDTPPPPITETVPGPAAQFTDPNLLAAAQQMPAPTAPPAGGGVDSAMRERYAALYPDDMVSDLIGQGVGSLPA